MSEEGQFWWNWTVQALTAVGTVSAVAVALFGNWIVTRLWSPKLCIALRQPERCPRELRRSDGARTMTDSVWYHVRVENAERNSPAKDVRLFLLTLFEADASGALQLQWSGEVPLLWSHQTFKPLAPTIGLADEADLCSLTKNPNGLHKLELHPLFRSFSLKAEWSNKCNLALIIQARCPQANSSALRVEIDWDGSWSDDPIQLSRHLFVKAEPVASP